MGFWAIELFFILLTGTYLFRRQLVWRIQRFIKTIRSVTQCSYGYALKFFYFTDEGEVFSWGNNEYGQLAVDREDEQVCLQHMFW